MANSNRAERVNLTLTKEQRVCLDELATLGVHGKNASEVAKTLITREIERLISGGFISMDKIKRGKS